MNIFSISDQKGDENDITKDRIEEIISLSPSYTDTHSTHGSADEEIEGTELNNKKFHDIPNQNLIKNVNGECFFISGQKNDENDTKMDEIEENYLTSAHSVDLPIEYLVSPDHTYANTDWEIGGTIL